jgi:hypothetical protein
MKPIKLVYANAELIAQKLAEVNGKATEHVFTNYWSIVDPLKEAEDLLVASLLPKSAWKGVQLVVSSGKKMPNAYTYKRKATKVLIERKASGWFILEISETSVFQDGGRTDVFLSKAQRKIMHDNVDQQFRSLKEE